MATSEVRLPFGQSIADGRLINIADVIRGLACECICPQCHAVLVAVKGQIVQHHFRHYADPTMCVAARETALHKFAKQVICEQLRLTLPADRDMPEKFGFDERLKSAKTEQKIGELRTDVLCELESGETIAVEIWVAHQVPLDNVEAYNEVKQAALEIDLRAFRLVGYHETADWERAVLFNAPRQWLSVPKVIRDARERRRQEEIAEQKRLEAAALEARRLAEAARLRMQNAIKLARQDEWLNTVRTAEAERMQERKRQRETAALAEAEENERRRYTEAKALQDRRIKEEERNKTEDARQARREWLAREKSGPDLQELVAAFGGYSRITSEAWAEHDRAMADWQARVRAGDFHRPPFIEV